MKKYKVEKVKFFDQANSKPIILKTKQVDYDFFKTKQATIFLPAKSGRLSSKELASSIVDSPFKINNKAVRKLLTCPGVKKRRIKKHLTVIEISKERLAAFGIQVIAGSLAMIAFPVGLAITSVCIGLVLNLNGVFKKEQLSNEMAYFYTFLIVIDLDGRHICKKKDLAELFRNAYLKIMKTNYPDVVLENDFDYVFDGLFKRGLINDSQGYYQIRKKVLIV